MLSFLTPAHGRVTLWRIKLVRVWSVPTWCALGVAQTTGTEFCTYWTTGMFQYFQHNLSRDMTKPVKWVCAQRRLRSAWADRRFRSAWASAQCDQSLRCALNGYLRTQVFLLRTAKTLIILGGCPGWSESSLGARSLRLFCHVAAHLWTKSAFVRLSESAILMTFDAFFNLETS